MVTFFHIPTGGTFDHGGNVWRKRSSRTAEIVQSRTHDGKRWAIHPYTGRTIAYFRNREWVNRESAWWRAMGVLSI